MIMDLNNKDVFNKFAINCLYVAICYVVLMVLYFYARGIKVTQKIINFIGLSGLLIGLLPFMLITNLSWQLKLIIVIFSVSYGLLYVTCLDKVSNALRTIIKSVISKK
jgi:RsiW-degrading membrane proteinase PrsW (M82 family)